MRPGRYSTCSGAASFRCSARAALLLWVAWRFGRLYCGWLCPHFSVVETINGLMRRASGRPSLWEHTPLPQRQADGSRQRPNPWYWLPTLLAVFVLRRAVGGRAVDLSAAAGGGLRQPGERSADPRQGLFIGVATAAFSVEFLFARHLFCRFGCAVGLFQSLSWMGNDRAMVVGFERARADSCQTCNNACDNVCPMRLKPRTIKRKMFTCTECAQCISACTKVQGGDPARSLLRWVDGADALATVGGRPRPVRTVAKPRPLPVPESTSAGGG